MRSSNETPITSLCRYDEKSIYIREHDVCDLIGNVSFTDVIFLDLIGRIPTRVEKVIVEGVLISLIEHGMSPSAIAARLTISTSPEALQGAVCAGLAGVGSVLVGSLEVCAGILTRITEAEDAEAEAAAIVAEYRARKEPIHGFGHPHFRPDDPRTLRLFDVATEAGVPGKHIAAVRILSAAVDKSLGKHLTINASAGMAAVLCEIGFPIDAMRGLAIICRSAGLVAHVHEEKLHPTARAIWEATDRAVLYQPAK